MKNLEAGGAEPRQEEQPETDYNHCRLVGLFARGGYIARASISSKRQWRIEVYELGRGEMLTDDLRLSATRDAPAGTGMEISQGDMTDLGNQIDKLIAILS